MPDTIELYAHQQQAARGEAQYGYTIRDRNGFRIESSFPTLEGAVQSAYQSFLARATILNVLSIGMNSGEVLVIHNATDLFDMFEKWQRQDEGVVSMQPCDMRRVFGARAP